MENAYKLTFDIDLQMTLTLNDHNLLWYHWREKYPNYTCSHLFYMFIFISYIYSKNLSLPDGKQADSESSGYALIENHNEKECPLGVGVGTWPMD